MRPSTEAAALALAMKARELGAEDEVQAAAWQMMGAVTSLAVVAVTHDHAVQLLASIMKDVLEQAGLAVVPRAAARG